MRRDRELAPELLLVDWNQPPAAIAEAAKDAERAMLGAVDQLNDASACFFAGPLDANQRAVAYAGDLIRARPPRRDDLNDGRSAVGFFVPLGRACHQFAVAIAAGDVGDNDRRQSAGVMQAFATPVDLSVVGEFAEHAIERGAIRIFGAKGARDLSDADLAAAFADEGDKFIA
jgi:hypothetical protein